MRNRPLSASDIRTIAEYLVATDRDLDTAISELGFDPEMYTDRELRRWLREECSINQDKHRYWS